MGRVGVPITVSRVSHILTKVSSPLPVPGSLIEHPTWPEDREESGVPHSDVMEIEKSKKRGERRLLRLGA